MIGQIARGLGLARQLAPRDSRPSPLESHYGPAGYYMGERMSTETALGVPTVYACIRILAETVGSTPLHAYREPSPGDRERSRNSNAWQLLHEEPNPSMSPVDLWTLMASWLVGWGDAFLGKQFAPNGELQALWPIHPERVDVGFQGGEKRYEVRPERGGVPKVYGPADVIQVMGQSFTGLRGVSPMAVARKEIAVAVAAQRYVGSVYQNTAVPRGALKANRELTDEAVARLRADWERIYGGPANAGRVAILEEGMEFAAISVPMKDVQFVEQQQLSVQMIARIFRVPLSLIQADTPGGLTYRTAETENLQFLTHGVRPWYVRIEQALNRDRDLFPLGPVEYCEFLPDALLRVATQERFNAYSIATGGKAWMRPSEVRAAENLPEDEELDEEPAATPAPVVPVEPVEVPA